MQSTGQSAHEVYLWLRGNFPEYGVSRADVCIDTTAPGAFERLWKFQRGFHISHNISQDQQGDWDKPGSPSGRTYYLGSKKAGSQALTRTYEKGKQLNANPDWVRFEVEVRPQSSKSKEALATMTPFEVMISVRWVSRMVLDMLDFGEFAQMCNASISTSWEATDSQRAFLALVNQYGKRLREEADRLGSWGAVGERIGEYMELSETHRKAVGGLGWNPYG